MRMSMMDSSYRARAASAMRAVTLYQGLKAVNLSAKGIKSGCRGKGPDCSDSDDDCDLFGHSPRILETSYSWPGVLETVCRM